MLTEIYIEALLVDEKLADQVWKIWDRGQISGDLAAISWWLICLTVTQEKPPILWPLCARKRPFD